MDQELGIRTDVKPSDWNNIQPRFQLTWNMGGRDSDVLKIGGGLFSSQPHYYAQVNNIQNSGTLLGAIDVTGNQVHTPILLRTGMIRLPCREFRREPLTSLRLIR